MARLIASTCTSTSEIVIFFRENSSTGFVNCRADAAPISSSNLDGFSSPGKLSGVGASLSESLSFPSALSVVASVTLPESLCPSSGGGPERAGSERPKVSVRATRGSSLAISSASRY